MSPHWHASILALWSMGCGDGPEYVGGANTEDPNAYPSDGSVVLNEISSQELDFLEVYNADTQAVDIGGWTLRGSDGVVWTMPQGAILGAGAHLAMSSVGGQTLTLLREGGIELANAEGEVRDQVDWVAGASRVSWCRFADGTGAFTVCAHATPGDENVGPIEAELLPSLWVSEAAPKASDVYIDEEGAVWLTLPADGAVAALNVQDGGLLVSTGPTDAFPADAEGRRGPDGIAQLSDGRLLLGDAGGQRVAVLDPNTLTISSWHDVDGLDRPGGFAVLQDESVLISDRNLGQLWHVEADGSVRGTLGAGNVDLESLPQNPGQMAVWGNIVAVASPRTPTVAVFDLLSGELLGSVGAAQQSKNPEPGRFATWAAGVAYDPVDQLLLLTDRGNGRVNVHDASDLDTLLNADALWGWKASFGRSGQGEGEMLLPVSVAVDTRTDTVVVVEHQGRTLAFDLDDVRDLDAGN